MYYILNEANHIIAADTELLSFCGVTHIDELFLEVALKKIQFNPAPQDQLKIDMNGDETLFPSHQISLSSMIGHLTLVTLEVQEKRSITVESTDAPSSTPEIDSFDTIDLFDTPATTTVTPTVSKKKTTYATEAVVLDMDTLIEENFPEKEEEVTEESILEVDVNTAPQIEEEKVQEIFIDLDEVSQKIGVSNDDYIAFFDEYVETANGLKDDLITNTDSKRATAIATLSHLGYMLYLPEVGDILTTIKEASSEEIQTKITHFYNVVSQIKIEKKKREVEVDAHMAQRVKKAPSANSFGTISLEGIEPIHFDFQLEQAASELSLPVELIEEFVNDFIDQAHTETVKMLDAYEKGDLDSIQKIGHLLKGASSNLRIVPLSDTLYQIQFCEDSSLLEGYIHDYWGHFLAFETQIKMISH